MRRWGTECAGTSVLVVVICCSSASGSALAPAAIGAATAILLALGPLAGGSYNPAVAAARWIRGEVTGRNLAGVLAAQLSGAVAAALAARLMLGDVAGLSQAEPSAVFGGLTGPSLYAAPALLAMESVGAFCVVYVVCRLRSVAASHSQAAVVIGLTVMAMTVTAGQFGAGLFNPAAGIAAAAVGLVSPMMVTACAAAQLSGALAAAVVLGVAGRATVAVRWTVATAPSERVLGAVGRAPRAGVPVIPRPRPAADHVATHHAGMAPVALSGT